MALELIKLSDLKGKIPGPDWIQPEYSLEMRMAVALRLTTADMLMDQIIEQISTETKETEETEGNQSLLDPLKKV